MHMCRAGYAGRLKTAARTPAKQQNTIADVRARAMQEPLLRPHQLASRPAGRILDDATTGIIAHSTIYSAVDFGMFELFCLYYRGRYSRVYNQIAS